MSKPFDAATARQLAVAASCDPRTVQRVAGLIADGLPVRSVTERRIRKALEEAGHIPKQGSGVAA